MTQIFLVLYIFTFVVRIASVSEPNLDARLRFRISRLRHFRHLERAENHGPMAAVVSSDVSYYQQTAKSTRDQELLGNRKPLFVNCSRYHPTVQEEQPAGTEVIQVTALDPDPPNAGGNVTYTFVSAPGERLKFSIGPVSGLISTSSMFDRDEPSREKEMYLTVRATDNGRPQLDDVCTIKVVIEDVNDNKPVFDKVNYVESVPQDLKPGREVMRISATDIDDGNNSIVVYELEPRSVNDRAYFRIDKTTGVIYLNHSLSDRDPGYRFKMNATATDLGTPPRSTNIELEILVVESHKKAPSFTFVPEMPIRLKENYNDYQKSVATLTAESNIPEEELVFMIVGGRTEQTNQRNTFILESEGSIAHIKLGRQLDYEAITEYTITVRVQNKYNLAAETVLNFVVEDVNDNIPVFTEVVSGTVLEHEPEGAPVMQVRAIDADGTIAHNQVTYELGDHQDLFYIDSITGNITTRVMFDREEKDFYTVKVVASDNSPSALLASGEPNRGQQVFHIEIGDINDNKPRFTKKVYVADAVEDANFHMLIAEVSAQDNDTASDVTYSIESGNTYEAFYIEKNTGKIRVNNPLDFENTTSYTLTVRAFDGRYEDYATVEIKIENVNDNRPVFLPYQKNVNIEEEVLVMGCIAKLEAYDPDIPNRNDPQHIKYFLVKEDQQKLLNIDDSGCLTLKKPLDRDPPDGYPQWQVYISAKDEDGGPSSLSETTEVIIDLTDINDNAPFLSMKQPVVWGENQSPGVITKLEASDNDSDVNGPPFEFELDANANDDIRSSFKITTTSSGSAQIEALRTFDREQQKFYLVPITISDSGHPVSMTGTSTLTVVIGDENDNSMKPGSSEIFVYNYKTLEGTVIGRVYVDDPDDWDLPDKTFAWKDGISDPNFDLNTTNGEIKVVGKPKSILYYLQFTVVEESSQVPRHSVDATVNVTVKEITDEAVDKSGSIRLINITAEEFVEPAPGNTQSRREMLRDYLANLFNISSENVDVFTVLHANSVNFLDVRFSAHSSPYYQPEKLNGAVAQHQKQLEELLDVQIWMVNIDECLIEKTSCESSCVNTLKKLDTPYTVFTNTSSFVGVHAQVVALCTCELPDNLLCLNGGTPVGTSCECPEGYDGPHCETIDVGFGGDGWAWYPPLQACEKAHLSLELQANKDNGLIFYVGPLNAASGLKVQDFMSLELTGGFAQLLVDYGSGTTRLEQRQVKLTDGLKHHIEIRWNSMSIELKVDSCSMESCLALAPPEGPNEFLNVNGPLQIGGASVSLRLLGQEYGWRYTPTEQGLSGCVRNLTFNDKVYNLGEPSYSKNAVAGCDRSIAKAVTFGIDSNFLVAILVCIAILLILVLAVVVHRRRSDDMYKDQDDIRENIINYEDEGGGEGDMTGYDLNVLRLVDGHQDEKMPQHDIYARQARDEVPDICGFLDGKKRQVDDDPDVEPFDNVRHYAYEGDGNSTGSLSSLASGTDEGDLNFDYLSDFGPRFRKLADMYGEHSSDESEENFASGGASESWC